MERTEDSVKKQIMRHNPPPESHLIGVDFPVASIINYRQHGKSTTPFLLLDYMAPTLFPPSESPRGVGEHAHTGSETVTLVFQGELSHRDADGNRGTIGPGEVEWMTAGSGVVHEEMLGEDFNKRGGMFEMAQLWVNLPAEQKKTSPRYQKFSPSDIPSVELPDGQGTVRVIAGQFGETKGPAETFTHLDVWDVHLHSNKRATFSLAEGSIASVVVLHGTVIANDATPLREQEFVILGFEGKEVDISAMAESHILIVSGAPILEALACYGSFIMNTQEELSQVMEDYQAGKLGRL